MNIARILLAEHLKNVYEARLSEIEVVEANSNAGSTLAKARAGGFMPRTDASAHDHMTGSKAEIIRKLRAQGVPDSRIEGAVAAALAKQKHGKD